MASYLDITLDDFDPPLVYPDQSQWSTPDPSLSPARFNQSTTDDGGWFQGTYHFTDVVGAKAGLNFTGRSLSLYGSTNSSISPSSFNVTLTSPSSSVTQTVAGNDSTTTPGGLLWEIQGLNESLPYEFGLENLGGGLSVDRVVYSTPVGAQGSTLSNTTLDETSSEIAYEGTWTSNSNDLFYGGSTIYTNGDGDSFSFNFTGSTLWIYGDQVNDHGPFSVSFNSSSSSSSSSSSPSPVVLSGASGCGGAFGKTCEKLGTLAFVVSGLPEGQHRVKLTNLAGQNGSYFDLDYIRYLTPSSYFHPSTTTNTSTPSSSSFSSSSASKPSGSSTVGPTSGTAREGSVAGGWVALGLCVAVWIGW